MADSGMSGIPGIGAMTDTLEFVKNLWGGMKIPGMAMPSLSVDDIDKQIADLKAVEAWLNVNMNMLRSTIQALEVQSATIAALHSMSASMASMVQPAAAAGTASAAGAPAASGAQAAQPAPTFNFSAPTADKPVPPGDGPAAAGAQPQQSPASPQETIGMNSAATFANPAAWWNLLQDQFRQAVTSAVASEPAPRAKAAPGTKAAANGETKEAPKPRARAKPKAAAAPKKRATKS